MAILDDYRYTDIIFEIKGEIGIIKVRGDSLSGAPSYSRTESVEPSKISQLVWGQVKDRCPHRPEGA
jgi:hypothetical protein